MKLLHTSDWHLGRFLFGRSRIEEQTAFLNWLTDIVIKERPELLLICGDIFETHTPPNRAQQIYYNFLSRVSPFCQAVFIIRGNHDSASLLSAPKEVLKTLNIFVVGEPSEKPEDDVFVIKDGDKPSAIVCAAAYMPSAENLLKHYSVLITLAEEKQAEIIAGGGVKVPIIALGHLTAEGLVGDRFERYAALKEEAVALYQLAARVDYFALGHIHSSMAVSGFPHVRYSGSSINMNPMKGAEDKKITTVELSYGVCDIKEIHIPLFQKILTLEGTLGAVSIELEDLIKAGVKAWVLVKFIGAETYAEAAERLNELTAQSGIEIINTEKIETNIFINEEASIDTRNPLSLFKRFLELANVAEEEHTELISAFQEILISAEES
jgi:exonuclease SbcD